MTRLPRSRRGKTPVDVTVTVQNGLKRVRLSMGDEGTGRFRNTDMDESEVEDLITVLAFKLKVIRGEVPWDET